MPPSVRLLVACSVVAALLGCREASVPRGAVVCEVATSSDACFRCQAQRCGAQLDRCHGAGFHEGRSVGTITRRCVWNSDTGQYDKDCTFSGGLGSDASLDYRNGRLTDAGITVAPAVPCGYYAVCFQACGCGSQCAATCSQSAGDAAVTTYYANDPRDQPGCAACVQSLLAPCVKRLCAAECGDGDAGP